jgi:hypothetical protein
MELFFIVLILSGSFVFAMRASRIKHNSLIPPVSLKESSVLNYSGTKGQIVMSVIGTSLGGAITVGFIGLIYRSGLAFYIAGICFLVGLVMLYAMISKIRHSAKENNFYSIEQYMSNGDKILTMLISIVNIFAFMGLLISQIISIKLLRVHSKNLDCTSHSYQSKIIQN